jgi:predicted oxidoreductase
MVVIPILEEEDGRRPSRERESLVGERTRTINSMEAALTRLGIRGFQASIAQRIIAPRRRARPAAWRIHAVKLQVLTHQILLSVLGASDKLVIESAGRRMSAAGLHIVAALVS